MKKLFVTLVLFLFVSSAYAQPFPYKKEMPPGITEGPGGCKSFEECDRYCRMPQNMRECMEFAKAHGLFEFIGPPGFGARGAMHPIGPPPFVEPSEFAREMPAQIMHKGKMAMRGPPIFPADVPPEEMLFGIIMHEHFYEIREMMEEWSDICPNEEELAELILERLYEMKEERFPEGDPCAELREDIEFLSPERMCVPSSRSSNT
jgi:hypothetical protein